MKHKEKSKKARKKLARKIETLKNKLRQKLYISSPKEANK
jgi:hypothetical protein